MDRSDNTKPPSKARGGLKQIIILMYNNKLANHE